MAAYSVIKQIRSTFSQGTRMTPIHRRVLCFWMHFYGLLKKICWTLEIVDFALATNPPGNQAYRCGSYNNRSSCMFDSRLNSYSVNAASGLADWGLLILRFLAGRIQWTYGLSRKSTVFSIREKARLPHA